ncbi:DNA glycosylase [Gaertneriomyces semiglobifer]|nr:DNA glycosylase [Gaertneriomyces semiglobifer]
MARPGLRPRPVPVNVSRLSTPPALKAKPSVNKVTSKLHKTASATARRHIDIKYEEQDGVPIIKEERKDEFGIKISKDSSPTLGKSADHLVKEELTVQGELTDLKVHTLPDVKNWKEVYKMIEVYRKDVEAPVDTCGCACLGRRHLGDKVFRFETLVALILSAQTPDLKLAPTIRNLQSLTPNGITPEALLALGNEAIIACLKSIGMQNQKAKALIETSKVCIERYDSDIPPDFQGLLGLPGVGPKIAALTMSNAWNQHVAIGVDTHVHRIANRLGWVKTANPEGTRKSLEAWLPREYWGPINPLLVGFGQTLCTAKTPGCNDCPVKNLCPKIGTKKK